ncbi:tetratricopeptide repeat protein [bacterium]|nr:tetratricopeptide repeat protein [bacterium]
MWVCGWCWSTAFNPLLCGSANDNGPEFCVGYGGQPLSACAARAESRCSLLLAASDMAATSVQVSRANTQRTCTLPEFGLRAGWCRSIFVCWGGDISITPTYAGAVTAYQRALDSAQAQAGVNVYNILIARGRAQRLAGNFEAAAQTLEQAADLEPDAPWAYLELATVQWAGQENQSEAERWIDRAAARNPEQPYVYIVRGQLCTAWGDLSCAVAAYEQALSLRVGDGWIYNQLADLYRRKAGDDVNSEDWAQARRYAEFAVEARPDDPWAHGQWGYIYARTSEFDEDAKQYREKAIEQYEESVAHAYSPVSAAGSYCSLGFAHQENQNPEQAIINYRLCADHSQNEQERIWAEERIANLSTEP